MADFNGSSQDNDPNSPKNNPFISPGYGLTDEHFGAANDNGVRPITDVGKQMLLKNMNMQNANANDQTWSQTMQGGMANGGVSGLKRAAIAKGLRMLI